MQYAGFSACSGDNKELTDEAAETETTETEAVESEVTQADIEENIIGLWMMAERNGQPVPTSENGVYDFESDRKAYVSASLTGDKMNWTALREDKDGKTFTVTFEMTRVAE